MASKSRIHKSNLNPVFHKRNKDEDCAELTKELVKSAKKTGILCLSNKSLATIPDKVWHILEPEKPVEVTLDSLCENDEDELWWNQKELTNLDLSSNSLTSISPKIQNLYSLTVLNDLSNNQITSLPGGMGFLVRLTELNCSYNEINELPADFVNMRSLQKWDMMHNNLKSLPEDIGQLRKLECLYVQHNDIEELPIFDGCEQLKELHISNNFIKEIPADFCEKLPHLKILDLRDNKIEKLTDEIAFLQNLIRLDLSNNSINSLPNCLSTLAHLQSLQLEGNPIKSIRRDILQCGTQRVLKTLRDRAQENSQDMALVKKPIIGESESLPDRYKIRKNRCLSVTMMGLSEIPEQVFTDALEENAYMVDFSKNKL
uniref:Leucine-rich repeat-containing protein 40 n=1 Tax=Megaselia scalaris TaxID=36166 RepID=T1GFI2_MEGSC